MIQLEQLKQLKNKYVGESCLLLNCGPSLNNYSKDQIRDFAQDKIVIAVKLAYLKFPDITDVHIFNCCNLPVTSDPFVHYNYHFDRRPELVVASSSFQIEQRIGHKQQKNLFFQVPIQKPFLAEHKKLDDWTFDKQPFVRPVGPGIFLEVVIFMIQWLGFSEFFSLGYDVCSTNEKDHEHFWDKNLQLNIPGSYLESDFEMNRQFSQDVYYWFYNKGVSWKVIGNSSCIYSEIPRIEL